MAPLDDAAIVRQDNDTFLVQLPEGPALPVSTASDGRPRVRDLDLARWLGFKQFRMIRKLIKRMVSEGKLAGLILRSTVSRRKVRGGGTQEFSVEEYWLTREQSLLVATQSNTPRAWALTTLMVEVFDAVVERHRAESAPRLPPPPPPDPAPGPGELLTLLGDLLRAAPSRYLPGVEDGYMERAVVALVRAETSNDPAEQVRSFRFALRFLAMRPYDEGVPEPTPRGRTTALAVVCRVLAALDRLDNLSR